MKALRRLFSMLFLVASVPAPLYAGKAAASIVWRRILVSPLDLGLASDAAVWGMDRFVVVDRRRAEVDVFDFSGRSLHRLRNHDPRQGGLSMPYLVAVDGESLLVFDLPETLHRYSADFRHLGQWDRPELSAASKLLLYGSRLWAVGNRIAARQGASGGIVFFDRVGLGFREQPSGSASELNASEQELVEQSLGAGRGLYPTQDAMVLASFGRLYRADLINSRGESVLTIGTPPPGYQAPPRPFPRPGPQHQGEWAAWARRWTQQTAAFELANRDIGILRRQWVGGAWRYALDAYDRSGKPRLTGQVIPTSADGVIVLRSRSWGFEVLERFGEIQDREIRHELVRYERQ